MIKGNCWHNQAKEDGIIVPFPKANSVCLKVFPESGILMRKPLSYYNYKIIQRLKRLKKKNRPFQISRQVIRESLGHIIGHIYVELQSLVWLIIVNKIIY